MKSTAIAASLVAALTLSACTTSNPYTGQTQLSNATGGTLIGAGAGAVAGGIIGAATGTDPRIAALIGAGIGGIAGAGVGSYMDQQEAELRAQLRGTGVSVTRVGQQIILNMPSNITFSSDSATVQQQFSQTLVSVALVLKKFPKTIVDVYGHTDSSGDDAYNLQLSQRRAVAVATLLSSQGVDQRRFFIEGRGEIDPISTNATEVGRATNRRVEIKLSPVQG
ncbi:MAG: cell envelope biosis protein OmpA [Devosia sp.]|nr:cell envelope biosis protein OmpA [Devosia sp.]